MHDPPLTNPTQPAKSPRMTTDFSVTGRTQVMGVVNVTPDSFSDGGQFETVDRAVAHGLGLLGDGADVLDVGGESTRPGSDPVSEAEERDRVIPVIEGLRGATKAPITIDTMKPNVARAAIQAGANAWNDVSALRHGEDAFAVAAELGTPIILMHMQGMPKTMQANPVYEDVVAEVISFLKERIARAEGAGVKPDAIWVDPGIGFGKTLAHNLSLIAATAQIREETGKPLLFGASRKRFIAAIDKASPAESERLGGSLAAALLAARLGADMVRVHDVKETVQALRVEAAVAGAG